MKLVTTTRKSMWRSALAILAGLAAPALYAQTTAIEGHAYGTKGEALAGAQVSIVRTDIRASYQVKTDKAGFFMQLGLPVGTYDLSLSVDGAVLTGVTGVRTKLGESTVVNLDLRAGGYQNSIVASNSPETVVESARTAQSSLAPPMVLQGKGMRTRFTVVNFDVVAGDFKLAFLDGSGGYQKLGLETIGTASAVEGRVVPGGSLSFRTDGAGDLQAVSAIFASAQKVGLFVRLEYVLDGKTAIEVSYKATAPQTHVVQPFSNQAAMGLLVVTNPDSSAPLTVQIKARTESGDLLGEGSLTVSALSTWPVLLENLIPATAGREGHLEISVAAKPTWDDSPAAKTFSATLTQISDAGFVYTIDPMAWQ